MRVLCDQNVPRKYLRALESADCVRVTTVEKVLQHDASDGEIVRLAESDDWVVFTNDEDFFVEDGDFGLLYFSQLDDPTPGAVVEAIRRIDVAYEAHDEVVENVPDGWA